MISLATLALGTALYTTAPLTQEIARHLFQALPATRL